MTRKLFCVIGANGSGKTRIMKQLIDNSMWYRTKVCDQAWNVLFRGEVKALVVGEYPFGKALGGADLLVKDRLWIYLEEASESWNVLVIEAQKLGYGEEYRKLLDFCTRKGFDLSMVMISVDPVTGLRRLSGRDMANNYKIETIMRRNALTYATWLSTPQSKRFMILNGDGKHQVATQQLEKIIFGESS